MHNSRIRNAIVIMGLFSAFGSTVSAVIVDPVEVNLFKIAIFEQSDDGEASPDSGDAYAFWAYFDAFGQSLDSAPLIIVPSLAVKSMTEEPFNPSVYRFTDGGDTNQFPDQAAFDSNYQDGSYEVQYDLVGVAADSFSMSITGDEYPPAPVFKDFGRLYTINPNAPFTVEWYPWLGASDPSHFISLEIHDSLTGQLIYESETDGDATSATIPAFTLLQGTQYEFMLFFINETDTVENASVLAYAGYGSLTSAIVFVPSLSGPTLEVQRLPDATEGQPYGYQLVFFGGSSPYSFEVSYGDLPSGLSVSSSGYISGTVGTIPDDVEEHYFGLRIWDNNQLNHEMNMAIFVNQDTGPAPDIFFFVTGKEKVFLQDANGATPVLDPSEPYAFLADAEGFSGNSLIAAHITASNGNMKNLMRFYFDEPYLDAGLGYASQAALDVDIPDGTVEFYFETAGVPGGFTSTLNFVDTPEFGNLYPSTPRLTAGITDSPANAVDPSQPINFAWDAWPDGVATPGSTTKVSTLAAGNPGADDASFMLLELEDATFGDGWFDTELPEDGNPADITHDATGFSIPADALLPGRVYEGALRFLNIVNNVEEPNTGATGIAGYLASTEFALMTTITFEQWLDQYGIDPLSVSYGDNLDGDDRTLLEEYFLLESPWQDGWSIWDELSARGRISFPGEGPEKPNIEPATEIDFIGQKIKIRYTRWTTASDLEYAIKASDSILDLIAGAGVSADEVTENIIIDMGTIQYVEAVIDIGSVSAQSRFYQGSAALLPAL